jgi:hypothetical protein
VLPAESFEKQIGERLQQFLRRWPRRERSSASPEIEAELVARVTSHLKPPQWQKRSMIPREGGPKNARR